MSGKTERTADQPRPASRNTSVAGTSRTRAGPPPAHRTPSPPRPAERPSPAPGRWDVVVAGARVAGAATAMLLARQGARVLVVDPARRGSDTLSTHAVMRAGVLQLHRWGLLGEVRASGTPCIGRAEFRYGDRAEVSVPIEPRHGIDGLYAPRRTVLDPILQSAARRAGAEVVHGWAVAELVRDAGGRVRGAGLRGPDGTDVEVLAPLVVGADGMRSKVARLLEAPARLTIDDATATIYGYVPGLDADAFSWLFGSGLGVGTIPTNDGATCVYAGMRPARLRTERKRGLEALFIETLRALSPVLARRVLERMEGVRLRAFAGAPSFLRASSGPGWALVGDAAYFKDPLTAHGITDALRDAELLARAVARGTDAALSDYEAERDALSRPLMELTARIASFDWTLDELQGLHRALSREMQSEVEAILAWDGVMAMA